MITNHTPTQLFRISVREKERDKRKNSLCREYVVLTNSLEAAKALAMAEYDPDDVKRDQVAAVGGYGMGTLVYNSDIFSSKKKEELPATLPDPALVQQARELHAQFKADHPDEDDDNAVELTKP